MRVLDVSPGGIITRFENDGDRDYFSTYQDIEPIVESNLRAQNEGNGYSPSREMRHIAFIPNNVLTIWGQIDGVKWNKMPKREFSKWARKWLADPDYRKMRASGGPL